MKKIKFFNKYIYQFLYLIGIDIKKILIFIKGDILIYLVQLIKLLSQKRRNKTFPILSFLPILSDKYQSGGTLTGHYFHQDLFVASLIYKNSPNKHVDVGSRIDGFVAHVACFRKIEVFDIRSMMSKTPNIVFKQADLMNLPTNYEEYCDSISSLHAIEHFGLGRYGDPIDYNGHLKGINNIHKILKKNGIFYFSVPIGKQKIVFNAHRVFSITYLIQILSINFKIINFSYVDDQGDFYENVSMTEHQIKYNFDCEYGCGIFVLQKL